MDKITVSKLPNITFYTGEYAEEAASALENRRYGEYVEEFGTLSKTNDNSSYWSNFKTNMFNETPIEYSNVGNIIDTTISYMNKFKNNNIDISTYKNVITINYNYEDDLESNYDNTYIKPFQEIMDLMLNTNEMTFNKSNYYNNNVELSDITYLNKVYPYNRPGTIYNVFDDEDNLVSYDFSHQFVNYKYSEIAYETTYTAYRYITREEVDQNGNISYVYIQTNVTYQATAIEYTYKLTDINKFSDKMYLYFKNNSDKLDDEKGELKKYFLDELDTRLLLTLNTYSLGKKNLFAYINFNSINNNWFNNVIKFKMNTENLQNNDGLLTIRPIEDSIFNININQIEKPCGEDFQLDEDIAHEFRLININDLNEEEQEFTILNPSKINTLDFSNSTDKLKSIDFISEYEKKLNVFNNEKTNWLKENNCNIQKLIIGNEEKISSIEILKGISELNTLQKIDITNCSNLRNNFSLRNFNNLNYFYANGSSLKSFVPKTGIELFEVSLPESIKTITLKNNTLHKLNYTPNYKLLNVTFENVQEDENSNEENIFNSESFIKTWLEDLSSEEHAIPSQENSQQLIPILYTGLINNTNLTGINWKNFEVDNLIKLSYVGLNKFSGNINIKGSLENNNLTRKEYINIKNIYSDQLESNQISFTYILDPNAYKKEVEIYIPRKNNETNEVEYVRYTTDTLQTLQCTINDTLTGNSFLDFIEENDTIEVNLNSDNTAFEIELNQRLNTESTSNYKNPRQYDIVIYKGNKLMFITRTLTNNEISNFIKVGECNIPNQLLYYKVIKLKFKDII